MHAGRAAARPASERPSGIAGRDGFAGRGPGPAAGRHPHGRGGVGHPAPPPRHGAMHPPSRNRNDDMLSGVLKLVGGAIGLVFIIGLLVVVALFSLVF